MIASMEGVVTLINPRENTSRTIAWEGISYSVEQYLTPDEKQLLMYNEEGFSVMDLEKQEFVRNKSVQEIENIELRYAVYDREKDVIYGYSLVDGLVSIEAETGKVTRLDAEKYEMADLGKDPFYFGMDAAGKRLFMVCWDGYLRVWDMEQQSTICEIPFDCTVNCFLKFTPDGSRIICMGDDYHLRVLNVEEQKYEYISTGQYWIVEDAQWSRDGKSILMHNSRELLILDAKTYEVLAEVEDAELYLQKKNKIWCIHQDTLYEFPYMDVQMLVDEFKSQFGDAKLTEYQRVKYHVD